MIKLLSILGSLGMMGTTAVSVVACGTKDANNPKTLDFSQLDTAIEQAEIRLNEQNPNKPEAAYQELTGVVDVAKNRRETAKSQITVNETAIRVVLAIDTFDNSGLIDKTKLEAKIKEAKELLANENKGETAKENLQLLIEQAELVLNDPNTRQAKVDKMIENLAKAMEIFNSAPDLGDKTLLEEKLTFANELLDNSKKSQETNQSLETAIQIAQVVFDNEAIQEEVDSAIVSLEIAIQVFQKTPDVSDKTKLKSLIAEAKELLANSKKSEAVKKFFRLSIEYAEIVLNDETASQETVDLSIKKLEEAIIVFEGSDLIDKSQLKTKIEEASNLIENSTKSKAVTDELQSVIMIAQAVFDNEDAIQTEVDQAVTDLEAAIEVFQAAPDLAEDKTALEEKIAEAKELLADSNKQSQTIAALKTVITNAQAVFDNEDAIQTEVDQAVTDLEAAIEVFQAAPDLAEDKTALEEKIAEAKELLANNSDKSEDAKRSLELIIAAAEWTLTDEDATQEEVDTEIEMLTKAMETFKNAK